MFSAGSESTERRRIELSDFSDVDVCRKYLGIDSFPALICSPLRKTDSKASFSVYINSLGKVTYKDFGTGLCGDIYDLVMKMYGLSFLELLEELKRNVPVTHITQRTVLRKSYDIKITVREWKDLDSEYWNSYGISKKWCEFAEIYPLRMMFVNDNMFGVDKHAYAYTFRDSDNTPKFKIYQPYSKRYKWMSGIDKQIWNLYDRLPEKGKYLFITSSLKDCLNLWSNTGIPATGPQGEGYSLESHINELKTRFKHIIVLYDNDSSSETNPGRTFAMRNCSLYGLEYMEIPEEYEAKDPSDLYKKYGKTKYLEILSEAFKNRKIYEQENSQY